MNTTYLYVVFIRIPMYSYVGTSMCIYRYCSFLYLVCVALLYGTVRSCFSVIDMHVACKPVLYGQRSLGLVATVRIHARSNTVADNFSLKLSNKSTSSVPIYDRWIRLAHVRNPLTERRYLHA